MDTLYRLKDRVCDMIDEVLEKPDITPTELERLYKAVDIVKDVATIEAMESADFDDYSYDDGMSYARNRDSRGRYSSRRGRSYDDHRMTRMDRGYSGDESKEEMMHKIEEMQRKVQMM